MVDKKFLTMVGRLLNAFPNKEGILKILSPAAIVLGNLKPNCIRLKITFGAYCKVYVGTTNTNVQRSITAIALQASNNWGSY